MSNKGLQLRLVSFSQLGSLPLTIKEVDMTIELKLKHSSERRTHPRSFTEIAVKLRRSARTLFTGGRTLDVSQGGASIELFGPREAHAGERIAIAFENLHCPVTRASRMIGAQVIRVEPMRDGKQRVAIEFDSLQLGFESMDLPVAA